MKLLEFCKLKPSERSEFLKGKSISATEFANKRNAELLHILDLELSKDWKESYQRSNKQTSLDYERYYCVSTKYNIWITLKVSIYKSNRKIESYVKYDYLGVNLTEKGKFTSRCSSYDRGLQIFTTNIRYKNPRWSDYDEILYHPKTEIDKDFAGFCEEVIKAREVRQPYIDILYDPKDVNRSKIKEVLTKYALDREGFTRYGVAGGSTMYDEIMIDIAVKMKEFNLEDWIIISNIFSILKDPEKEFIYDLIEKNHIKVPNDYNDPCFDRFIEFILENIDFIKEKLVGEGDYLSRIKKAKKEIIGNLVLNFKTYLPVVCKKYKVKKKDIKADWMYELMTKFDKILEE